MQKLLWEALPLFMKQVEAEAEAEGGELGEVDGARLQQLKQTYADGHGGDELTLEICKAFVVVILDNLAKVSCARACSWSPSPCTCSFNACSPCGACAHRTSTIAPRTQAAHTRNASHACRAAL